MKRHIIPVCTVTSFVSSDAPSESFVWELTYIEGFVQATAPIIFANPTAGVGAPVGYEREIEIYTQSNLLTRKTVEDRAGNAPSGFSGNVTFPAMVYWEERWYEVYAEAPWAKMGRQSHRRVKCLYNTLSPWWNEFTFRTSRAGGFLDIRETPNFKTQHIDFITEVNNVSDAVNLFYLPEINKLKQEGNK